MVGSPQCPCHSKNAYNLFTSLLIVKCHEILSFLNMGSSCETLIYYFTGCLYEDFYFFINLLDCILQHYF